MPPTDHNAPDPLVPPRRSTAGSAAGNTGNGTTGTPNAAATPDKVTDTGNATNTANTTTAGNPNDVASAAPATTANDGSAVCAPTEGGYSLWRISFEKLRANRTAMTAAGFLLVVLLLCFIAPLLLPVSALEQNLALGATPPSLRHWLGTDELGRDLLARLLVGGRISFAVGFLATAVSLLIGVAYGVLSGLAGGLVDRVMMRFVELVQALPFIIFVILLVTLFGRQLWLIFIAIGAVEWLTMARIIRTQVLELKSRTFVQAAQVMGQPPLRIATRHLLPNLFGLIIVYASLTVPAVILLESLLSFLGLGVQAPMTSWGDLLKVGAENMEEYPWQLIFPAALFCLTLLSLNTLGDALREAFDPRS